MSTPQAKRRRLNDAAKTLHKPFKSPFRTPLKPSTNSDPPSSGPVDDANARAMNTSRTPAISPHSRPSITTHSPNPPRWRPSAGLNAPGRPSKPKTSPSLAREIMALRSDIQVLNQAHALATSTKDAHLDTLTEKWRTASRAAAEELFAGTRDRVNRMGGVGAWREKEREQREWREKWDREEIDAEKERRATGEGDDREGNGDDRYVDVDIEAEVKENGEEEQEEEHRAGDDSFTMDMMLKTLHIDLKLIGYDKEAQRWDG